MDEKHKTLDREKSYGKINHLKGQMSHKNSIGFHLNKSLDHQLQQHNKQNGLIFINPNKIKLFEQKELKNAEHSKYQSCVNVELSQTTGSSKIFVNPYFKNSDVFSSTSQNSSSRMQQISKQNSIGCKMNTSHQTKSNLIEKITTQSQEATNSISNDSMNSCLVTRKQSIYINQHFSKQKKEINSSSGVHKNISNCSLGSNADTSCLGSCNSSVKGCLPVSVLNFSKTTRTCIRSSFCKEGLVSGFLTKPTIRQDDQTKEKSNLNTRPAVNRCESDNTVEDQKIFLNSEFVKGLIRTTTNCSNSLQNKPPLQKSQSQTLQDNNFEISRSNTNTLVKNTPLERTGCSSTTAQSLLIDRFKTVNNTKIPSPRKRTSSTCLVSLSATKVVRRRKSNLKLDSNAVEISSKPSFLSKTKLIKNTLLNTNSDSRKFNKNKITKVNLSFNNKLKSLSKKNSLECVTPNTPSKQIFTRCSSNMVSVVPTPNCVMKVKSNNGKSLKLVHSLEKSNDFIKPTEFRSPLNKPLFLTKTKLVRKLTPGNDSDNDISVKTNIITAANSGVAKTKQDLSKYYLNSSVPNKIDKQRRQNMLWKSSGLKNIVDTLTKPSSMTKMQFNKGKTLKLIHQGHPEINRTEKSHIVFKRKELILHQMNKNKRCMLRNKLRTNKFRKINVSDKRGSFQQSYQSKYVYKKADTSTRKLLIKADVLNRNQKLVKVQGSTASDKTKFIKSKYNLIRTNVYNLKNAAFRGSKESPASKLGESRLQFGKERFIKVQVSTANEKTKFIKSKYNLVRKNVYNFKNPAFRGRKESYTSKLNESRLKSKWRVSNSSCKRSCKRKELSIVNIGGVFYSCSRTSLSRNKPKQVLQKCNAGTVLNIRGQKFKLEKNGLTLTCLDKMPKRKRIDIGGVTFISSSSGNSLTRTNYHTARSILVHAKQKSISLLTRKLKKINEPCLFFHRFGKCSGNERGTCIRQHNPKYVAICKKFVQGLCSESQCLLSHNVSCHNMPTCQHFLAGHCSRDHCLYPHIKVGDSAPICLDFLKGYCELGDQCTKRHRDICPSFEKGGCSRGKYCPYPHPKPMSGKCLVRQTISKKQKPVRDAVVVSNSNLRYFEDVNLQKENEIDREDVCNHSEEEGKSEDEEDGRKHPFRNRPKLGQLPSFIPLTSDKSLNDVYT